MMSISRSLLQYFLVASLGGLLMACEGSNTVSNPNLGSSDLGYTGPPARTADIRSFELNFWNFLKEDNRCGQCHTAGGQPPTFVDKTDVNAAYSQAIQNVSLVDPQSSNIVTKAATGHNCWLGQSAGQACADNIEQMIINWANGSNITSARLIQLTAPAINAPGNVKSFPASATAGGALSFANTVHPLLKANCQGCHIETATPLPIAPFFANNDPASAYEAAKPKMDIDTPSNSRFVVRLDPEFHNCWTNSCTTDAITMRTEIENFAGNISARPIDTTLVTSAVLTLGDGIVAAGGNRHESNLVALWEFRTGSRNEAFDTSGIDPSITLQLFGSYQWLGGYGLDLTNAYAIADNFDSTKLKTFIEATGEYAIEAWVVPANVTQQNANIVGYSAGSVRNFTLGQEMYNYEMYNRIDDPDPLSLNGEPLFTTGDSGEELLQSSLQHVVANYDPLLGRSVYINGVLVNAPDPNVTPTSIGNVVWSNNFAFVLGADVAGLNNWDGHVRLVAIHNRTLTPAQIIQNFDVGVGEKFFLLFWVGEHLGEVDTDPKSFILFEVSQYDSYSYLFDTPRFINLDPAWTPNGILLQGMRIGINGREALAGQAYASIDTIINVNNGYNPQLGQQLSPLGTIIALDKSAAADEFFLTFERFGNDTHAFNDPKPAAPIPPVDPLTPVVSDIGLRTFEEINSAISVITGVPTDNGAVKGVYDNYIQQLPTVETIDAFLPSHQMAIAQLALTSCSELVDNNESYFDLVNFSFSTPAQSAFNTTAKRDAIIKPLLTAAMNIDNFTPANNLTSQPVEVAISDLLSSPNMQNLDTGARVINYQSLITEMLSDGVDTTARTAQIVKAVCAAATGGAVMLVQ